jgi:hypothetical protein
MAKIGPGLFGARRFLRGISVEPSGSRLAVETAGFTKRRLSLTELSFGLIQAIAGWQFHTRSPYVWVEVVPLFVSFVSGVCIGSLIDALTHTYPQGRSSIIASAWIARVAGGAGGFSVLAAIVSLAFHDTGLVLMSFLLAFAAPFSLFVFGRGALRIIESLFSPGA